MKTLLLRLRTSVVRVFSGHRRWAASLEGPHYHVGLVGELVGADKHIYRSGNNRNRKTRTHVSLTRGEKKRKKKKRGNNIRIDPGNTLIWLEWRMSGFREHKPGWIHRKWVKGIIQHWWI